MDKNIEEVRKKIDQLCLEAGTPISGGLISQILALIEETEKNQDCQDCVFLLHYERNIKGQKNSRCSIEFRDGSKVNHPCKDKIVKKQEGILRNETSSMASPFTLTASSR